jgi:hypothetical protein
MLQPETALVQRLCYGEKEPANLRRRIESGDGPSRRNKPPPIKKISGSLGKATIFFTLDSRSEYWQIPLTEWARKYTAFVNPDGGQYAFKESPFRFQRASRTCTQFVGQEVLAGLMREYCMRYLDNVCVYSRSSTSTTWP